MITHEEDVLQKIKSRLIEIQDKIDQEGEDGIYDEQFEEMAIEEVYDMEERLRDEVAPFIDYPHVKSDRQCEHLSRLFKDVSSRIQGIKNVLDVEDGNTEWMFDEDC